MHATNALPIFPRYKIASIKDLVSYERTRKNIVPARFLMPFFHFPIKLTSVRQLVKKSTKSIVWNLWNFAIRICIIWNLWNFAIRICITIERRPCLIKYREVFFTIFCAWNWITSGILTDLKSKICYHRTQLKASRTEKNICTTNIRKSVQN